MIRRFGTLSGDREVEAIELAAGELRLTLLTLGSITQDIRLDGVAHALTLGSPEPAGYERAMTTWGPICGPVVNRIGGSRAEIDGVVRHFETRKPGPILHSGPAGIHREVWTIEDAGDAAATLSVALPDGEGGFPGNRRIVARWTLEPPSTIDLVLDAKTDAPTLMNLAHHPYWDLDGGDDSGSSDWGGVTFEAAAPAWLEAEDDLPTGAVVPVEGTHFDFRSPRRIAPDDGPLDHNLCLATARRPLTDVARLTGRNGVTLAIATTEPGLQIYDGRRLAEAGAHDGRRVDPYSALALEPQFWPDAPNHPDFPSIILRPGESWRQHTRYTFSRG